MKVTKKTHLEWSTVLWTDTSLSILLWLTSDLFPLEMVIPQMKHISRSIVTQFVTSCVTEGRGLKLSDLETFEFLECLYVTIFCFIMTACVTRGLQNLDKDIVSNSLK